MQYIECPDLSENKAIDINTTINNKLFRLVFSWNEYCECCFLDIYNSEGKAVNTGNALCCNTVIHTDKRILPHFVVKHKDNLCLEPTAETMKDYRIFYADTEDE